MFNTKEVMLEFLARRIDRSNRGRRDDAAGTGAGVRKPAGKEPAGGGAMAVPRSLWVFGHLVFGGRNDNLHLRTTLGCVGPIMILSPSSARCKRVSTLAC